MDGEVDEYTQLMEDGIGREAEDEVENAEESLVQLVNECWFAMTRSSVHGNVLTKTRHFGSLATVIGARSAEIHCPTIQL